MCIRDSSAFIQTYLRRKKIKHKAEAAPIRRERKTIGRRLHITLAPTKETYRAGDTISFEIIHADTSRAGEFFRPDSFDVVVADAPYGVQHGSRAGDGGLRRRPVDLLAEALPGWVRVLRPGGAVGIAVNTLTCPRDEALSLLADAGLEPRDDAAYRGFQHRVDRAIARDLVVGSRLD